jgi:hypothetical protein
MPSDPPAPGLTTANKTRSTPQAGASGIPITRGRPPILVGVAFYGSFLKTIRRLMETTRVMSESAAVRGLSMGKTPPNP